MLVLTLRTDNPEAEIGLYDGTDRLEHIQWHAHRQLAETIHLKINELLEARQKELKDIQGAVVLKGPGSFTGLRIGLTVANALADSLNIPICGQTVHSEWQSLGIKRLLNGENEKLILPEYGSPPHITKPKH
jgi:tRNA threonylcarbamoyladenosine biosynthesis protein TsaB